MDLPISPEYIRLALEKEQEGYAWELWVSFYPYMALQQLKFISFNEWKDKLYSKQQKYTNKSSEEIIEEFEKLLSKV